MRPVLGALTAHNETKREYARLVGFRYHGRSITEYYCKVCGEQGVTFGTLSPDMLESLFSNQRIGKCTKCVKCCLSLYTLDAKGAKDG